MKRIISLVMAIFLTATLLTGCGNKKDRILYNDINLKKYVDLGDYEQLPVDTNSDTFKGYYGDVVSADIQNNNFFVKKTEGKVANGDVANIDYTGKLNGVAFEGGTDKGFDLEIGSNSFIDGFESGLIGVDIGSTVDLNLTFPTNYQSTELAGKAVVFTVKVNFVKTETPLKPEEFYGELGFKNLKAYEKDAQKRAAENYLFDTIVANSKVLKYPKRDKDFLLEQYMLTVEKSIQSQTGQTLETYLQYLNKTEEEFKKEAIKEEVEPVMDQQLVLYALLDDAGIEVTDKDIKKALDDTVKEINVDYVDAKYLKEYYGEFYFETLAVNQKAIDFLYKKAKIS